MFQNIHQIVHMREKRLRLQYFFLKGRLKKKKPKLFLPVSSISQNSYLEYEENMLGAFKLV